MYYKIDIIPFLNEVDICKNLATVLVPVKLPITTIKKSQAMRKTFPEKELCYRELVTVKVL